MYLNYIECLIYFNLTINYKDSKIVQCSRIKIMMVMNINDISQRAWTKNDLNHSEAGCKPIVQSLWTHFLIFSDRLQSSPFVSLWTKRCYSFFYNKICKIIYLPDRSNVFVLVSMIISLVYKTVVKKYIFKDPGALRQIWKSTSSHRRHCHARLLRVFPEFSGIFFEKRNLFFV